MATGDEAKLVVLNEAMHGIGGAMEGSEIPDFDISLPGVPDVRRRYDTIIADLLGAHPWTWSKARVQLSRVSTPPASGFAYRYVSPLPGAAILAIYTEIDSQRPYHVYRIIDGQVHTDLEEAWGEVLTGADPDRWPAYFRTLAITVLMAELAIPVAADRFLAREKRQIAYGPPGEDPHGGLMRAAKQLDGQQERGGLLTFGPDPLTSARYS